MFVQCPFGGPEEIRTPDPHNANVMRSPTGQWYAPKRNSEKGYNLSKNIDRNRKNVCLCEMSGVFCRKSFDENTAHLFPETAFWDAAWLADNGGTGLYFRHSWPIFVARKYVNKLK